MTRWIARGSAPLTLLIILAVGLHVLFCLSLNYHFLNPLFYITMYAKGQGGPFFGIYQSGVNLLNGDSIYASENYRAPSNVVVPYYHFYRYLPFCSYVSFLFSRVFKPWPAYWAWLLVNELVLMLCMILTLRLRDRYGTTAVVASTFWLLYSPLYVELYMGQFCFMMAFFIFILFYPYLRGRAYDSFGNQACSEPDCRPVRAGQSPGHAEAPVGAAGNRIHDPTGESVGAAPSVGPRATKWIPALSWVLSLLLKSFTALYAFTFLRTGRKKLAATGFALVIITSIPYFLFHPQDLAWFINLNLQPIPPTLSAGCFGFCGFLRDISNRLIPFLGNEKIQLGLFDIAKVNVPLVLFMAVIFMLTFLLTLRKKRIDLLGNISLWTLTFFLIFKDIWEYHYVMLLPIFVGFYLRTRSKYLLVLFILLAAPTPFFIYDIAGTDNPQFFWSTPLSLFHHSLKAVPTLLLYIWIVRRELRESGGLKALLSFKAA